MVPLSLSIYTYLYLAQYLCLYDLIPLYLLTSLPLYLSIPLYLYLYKSESQVQKLRNHLQEILLDRRTSLTGGPP